MECDDKGGRYVPWELMSEILIQLPVKSLLRFSCVCKLWRTLIRNNPHFAIRHYYLDRYSSSSLLMDNVDYFIDYAGCLLGARCTVKDDDILQVSMFVLNENKTFRIVKKIELGGAPLTTKFSNFCHGILCIRVSASSYFRGPKGGAVVTLFCNPATGEVVQLPSPVYIKGSSMPGFGLGFDSLSNDFKILALAMQSAPLNRHWIVELYSHRSGCWRSLQSDELGLVQKFERLYCPFVLNANDRILNVFGQYRSGKTRYCVVSFDVVDEVFREIPLPGCLRRPYWCTHHLLPTSRWHACLCCAPYSGFPHKKNNTIDIWVLNSSIISADDTRRCDDLELIWIKQFCIRFPGENIVRPMNVWMNDKELFVYVQREDKSLEEVFLYDLCSQELKRTGRKGSLCWPSGYKESLVSINGIMSSCSGRAVPEQHGNARKDGEGLDVGVPEDPYDCNSVFFIRQVSPRNDVHWCHSFDLV